MATDVDRLLAAATKAGDEEDWGRAGEMYLQILAMIPGHVGAVEAMGRIAYAQGDVPSAVTWLRRAVELRPEAAHVWANLGMVLAIAGNAEEAIEAYRKAISIQPGLVDAYNHLGDVLQSVSRFDEAIATYRIGLGLQPDMTDTLVNLGNALGRVGAGAEAVEAYRRAIELRADFPEAHHNLAIELGNQGRVAEAVSEYRRAIGLRPDYAEAFNHLGLALHDLGDLESIEHFARAVELNPGLVEARLNLAQALRDVGRLEEARACCEKGGADPLVASSRIFTLLSMPGVDENRIAQEHREWNERFVGPFRKQIGRHENDRSPGRKLRVGYVARNLGNHPLGRFLRPVFEHHDRERFEVFCYCDVVKGDHVGGALMGHADVWRSTLGMGDGEVAEAVRRDRIDILVDLMMQAGTHRLMVFARKPAPVQVSYLAYPGSSGLETMDYRFSDVRLDPPGGKELAYGHEQVVRLPHCFWCYSAPPEAPAVGPLPALETNTIAFGCLNTFGKVNGEVMKTFGAILRRVEGSRLILQCFQGEPRRRAEAAFASGGIDPRRIEFVGYQPMAGYFEQHNRIDVGLDPFPYPGGTTTCDALWMGVPVASLAGETPLSRGGASILGSVGLEELVARSREEYVEIAVRIAGDLERLEKLRASLRDRMRGSGSMDGAKFVEGLEAAYREMWGKWCGLRS